MNLKHTPGPWEIRKHTYRTSRPSTGIYAPDGSSVAAAFDAGANIASLAIRRYKTDEVDANARLIAAAPDLLEALEAIVECGGIGPEDMFDNARVAITKAKGTKQ